MRKIPQTHIVCTSTLKTRDVAALQASSDGRVWERIARINGVMDITGTYQTLPAAADLT
jgi:hypothetical protein